MHSDIPNLHDQIADKSRSLEKLSIFAEQNPFSLVDSSAGRFVNMGLL